MDIVRLIMHAIDDFANDDVMAIQELPRSQHMIFLVCTSLALLLDVSKLPKCLVAGRWAVMQNTQKAET